MSFDIKWTEYGPISDRLQSASLAELCVEEVGVQTGPFGSQLHRKDYVESGTPIITVEHLGDNRIAHINTPFVSDEDKNRLSKYHLQKGDIVFSRVGSVDRRALVRAAEDGWLFSGRCLRVRADNEKINPIYLSYFFGLESFKNYIRSIAVGATMPSLNTKLLSGVSIYYPESLEEQKLIAGQLYTIDEKIELNRQMNQTLEQIAQAIFKSWFVDFEPTRAKIIAKEQGADLATQELAAQAIICGVITLEQLEEIEQNLETTLQQAINEKLTRDNETPINAEQLKATAALFPNELVESELGEIPTDWEVKALSEMVELIGGGTPKRSEPAYWGGSICWFSVKDAPSDGNVFVIDTDEKITEAGLNGSSTKLLPLGTTIITARGTVGRLALTGVITAMNQSCYGIRGIEGTGPYLNYLQIHRAVETLQQNTHGAVFDTITRTTFETVFQAQANVEIRECFEKLVAPIFEKIKSNLQQISVLSELRDTLLPKLLSGELSLAENE